MLSIISKLIPHWIQNKLLSNYDQQGLKKYFFNTGWMFFAKIISLGVSFFTIAILARYLGPENFGKLSYAQSFVAIFSVFCTLGINQILYRELSAHPEQEREILGTAFLSTLFFGSITLVTTLLFGSILHDDYILTWLVAIIALNFIFQPFGILSVFFQSKVKAKYPSIIKIVLAFTIPALKLLVVFLDQGILFIAGVILAETIITIIGYLYVYVRIFKQTPFLWTFSIVRLRSLLRDSWPLVLASLSGYIYGRIDQIMIQNLLDSASVAYYDIAVRLTELTAYLPGVIIASVFPAIVMSRKNNLQEYRKRFLSLTKLTISITFASSLALVVIAPTLITMLFGVEYATSISILSIYAWTSIGLVGILLIQQYFIIENKSKQFLLYSITGATVNIFLNFFLIKQFGVIGAATATLLTFSLMIIMFLASSYIYTAKDNAL